MLVTHVVDAAINVHLEAIEEQIDEVVLALVGERADNAEDIIARVVLICCGGELENKCCKSGGLARISVISRKRAMLVLQRPQLDGALLMHTYRYAMVG